MTDFKSVAHITVPKKNVSDGGIDTQSTENPIETVTPNESPENRDKPGDLDKEATEPLNHNVKAEGGKKNSADKTNNRYETYLDKSGKPIAVIRDQGNPFCIPIKSKSFEHIVRREAKDKGIKLTKSQLYEYIDELEADTEMEGYIIEVYHRVAPINGGIELDAGDKYQNRYRITAGHYEKVEQGSEIIFTRANTTLPYAAPADHGDLSLLDSFLNLDPLETMLLKGYLSYVLAHSKIPISNFPFLGLLSGQGTGKSVVSKLIIRLIDPNTVGVQTLPTNPKDLAIALRNAHILCCDNIRGIKQSMSDMYCIAATGGTISSRALYTNEDQHLNYLHGALVFNSIHDFISESDMAERSLILHPKPINPSNRKSEAELELELERDLPAIQRGLFNLIADIFEQLPHVKATNPERMIELSEWYAAMEKVHNAPEGAYQTVYSDNLRQTQYDSLLENVLATSVIQFAESLISPWKDTPAELLNELNCEVSRATQRSPNWPQNSIALSKRLRVLQAGLKTQGVIVDFQRGKRRQITINTNKLEEK